MFAVIGGSGLTQVPELQITRRQIVRTPYGLPSAPLLIGKLGSQEIVFLARHGLSYTLAPHEINYRANIWALHSLGIHNIISVSAVTSLNPALEAGSLVLPDDLIDYTFARAATYFEGESQEIIHADFSDPYDIQLRDTLLTHADSHRTPLHNRAIYGCIQGPRTPTRAEMRRYRNDGIDIIGMTGMPEAILARELNIPYVHLCGVVYHADSSEQSTHLRSEQTHHAISKIRQLLVDL